VVSHSDIERKSKFQTLGGAVYLSMGQGVLDIGRYGAHPSVSL
jgi:hypothetical protein